MTAHRTAVPAALAGAAALLLPLLPLPAAAHGAPADPLSRTAACGPPGGEFARSPGCRGVGAWDDLRLPDVRGRDRGAVPDGRLCGAGRDAYRALDSTRTDWPVTRLRAGDRLTLRYASTIEHRGTFSVHLTRPGYDPSRPLTWSDLDREPFLTATDPEFRDGAYRMAGRLPGGRTGRHLLYTIWRNTDTPDTYYACSDVVLVPAGGSRDGETAPR
ncbi:lytic polysaccharide monooxygenase, partial [Streptomyces lycii]